MWPHQSAVTRASQLTGTWQLAGTHFTIHIQQHIQLHGHNTCSFTDITHAAARTQHILIQYSGRSLLRLYRTAVPSYYRYLCDHGMASDPSHDCMNEPLRAGRRPSPGRASRDCVEPTALASARQSHRLATARRASPRAQRERRTSAHAVSWPRAQRKRDAARGAPGREIQSQRSVRRGISHYYV